MFSAPLTTGEPVSVNARGLRICASSAKCARTASISTLRQLAHHAATKGSAAARFIVCPLMTRPSPRSMARRMAKHDLHVNYVDLRLSVMVGNRLHDGHPSRRTGRPGAIERLAHDVALVVGGALLDALAGGRQAQ